VAAAGASTPPSAQEIANSFLASYEATWATSVPGTGAAVSAFLDACYLDGGDTKALNTVGFDNNLPNSIGWNRYRIGAKRSQVQVLADRTLTNPDGSTRRELDVQYRVDYADGTSTASDKETLISGSSAGSVMADGSACSTPEVGSQWRFLGNRRKVFVALRPGNERAMHFQLDTGAPWDSNAHYSKFIQFRIQDPANVAKYAVVTGPGLPTSGVKLLSPRLQRDDPLMAGKRGHYVNLQDGGNFHMCRVDANTGNVSAATADCVGMGASGINFGNYGYTDAALLDTDFATIGFVQGGVYNFAIYNDDGWKTVNGQAAQTPVATYKRTLTTLPYSAAALAGTDINHDLYPRLASSLSTVDMAASVRNKTGFTTNLSWNPLGTLPDARRFGWGGVYFYESGPVTAETWPQTDQEWDVYPDAGVTSVTGLTASAPSDARITPNWAEAGIYLDDRNGARLWSTVTFN